MRTWVVLCTLAATVAAVAIAVGLMAAQFWLWGLREADLRQMAGMTVIAGGLVAPTFLAPLFWLKFRDEDLSRQLREAALTDALTGAPNRRAFFSRLSASAASRPGAGPVRAAILMIDVDRFKAINDRLGHDAGDAALVHVADRIGEAVARVAPEGSSFARIGGEEFAVLLEGAGLRDAVAAAEAICAGLRAAPFARAGEVLPVTVSIGVWSGEMRDRAEAALAEADRAAYAAKAKGRDRWEVARAPAPPRVA